MTIVTGTPYFQTRYDALRYYKPYGYNDIDQVIQDKIDTKEIFICIRPPVSINEKIVLNTEEGRFYIETKEV